MGEEVGGRRQEAGGGALLWVRVFAFAACTFLRKSSYTAVTKLDLIAKGYNLLRGVCELT